MSHRKKYKVIVNDELCKGCGLCIGLCPRQVWSTDKQDKAKPYRSELCIGCMTCVLHCPDFCIEVIEDKEEKEEEAKEVVK